MPSDFAAIFTRLRAILQKNIGQLSVKDDTPNCYCLQGGLHPTHKTPLPIAWVQIGKAYVSYHLMPVYGCPKLLDGYSPKLKARMQGKSCFNFKTIDEALFTELDHLTAHSFAAFKKSGYFSGQSEKKRP